MAQLNSLKSAAPAVATQPADSSSFGTYIYKAKNSLLKVKKPPRINGICSFLMLYIIWTFQHDSFQKFT